MKWLWDVICAPFRASRLKKRLNRLIYAYEKLQDESLGMDNTTRLLTLEATVWLIRYYKGDADAVGEGSPDIRLEKLLRTPVSQFTNRELIHSRVLSHWIQYEHIDGF